MSEIREAAQEAASEHRLTIRAAAGRPRRDPFVFSCSCGFEAPGFRQLVDHLPLPEEGPAVVHQGVRIDHVEWDESLVRWWDRSKEEEA